MSEQTRSNRVDFTSGSIVAGMIRFMNPVLGALILQAAYSAAEGDVRGSGRARERRGAMA